MDDEYADQKLSKRSKNHQNNVHKVSGEQKHYDDMIRMMKRMFQKQRETTRDTIQRISQKQWFTN